jgi:Transposase
MKKISTVAANKSRNISEEKLTVGMDLGDRSSCYCVLEGSGRIILEQRVSTTKKALGEVFGGMPRSRIALETGMHSPWVSRLLSEYGHEVIVAHARNVRLIGESRKKDDRLDAQTLARLARIDPQLLSPVKHRSAGAGRSDGDPGASGAGAGADGAGEHGAGAGQELRRAVARVQCAEHESGESGRAEPGAAEGAGATADGECGIERADRRVQRAD